MDKTKKIFDLLFIVLAFIAIAIDGAFIYYKIKNKDSTITTNNIGLISKGTEEVSITDEIDKTYFIELNYFSNKNNNGTVLQELKFNYFDSITGESKYAVGMQSLFDYKHLIKETYSKGYAETYIDSSFYYYNSEDRESWAATTALNKQFQMIISIDNELFLIQLDKIDVYFQIFGLILEGHAWIYPELFEAVFNSVESCSYGYGDYFLKLDLSKFFTVKKYNTSTGKFEFDDEADTTFTYVRAKVHYDENGAQYASQSLFGSIEYNPKYSFTGAQPGVDYWQERVLYTLTEDDFNYRQSETYGGYLATLKLDAVNMLNKINRKKINVELNLQNTMFNSINLVGLDYNALFGLDVDTLKITGNSQKFYFLENSLKDTNLKTLQHSETIELTYLNNASNNEFTEVIL